MEPPPEIRQGARIVEAILREALSDHRAGHLEKAGRQYHRALELDPRCADARHGLGVLAFQRGDLDAAAREISLAIQLGPEFAHFHENLGKVLRALRRWTEAADAFGVAISKNPGSHTAHRLLGVVRQEMGNLAEAERNCRTAAELAPNDPEAQSSLGNVLQAMFRWSEAAECYERAIALRPAFAEAHSNLSVVRLHDCRFDDAMAHCEEALRIRPDYPNALRNLTMLAVFHPGLTVADLRRIHERVGRAWSRPRPVEVTPLAGRPLRVGYLTSDLAGQHPVVANLRPLLRHHDRARVTTFVYANIAFPDAVTNECRAMADGWCDTSNMSDSELADRVRADAIDILVCAAGRLDRNRPQVLGYRAAPVQISMLDAATSGLAETDYIVADRWVIPRNPTEYFSERPLRLPVFCFGELPNDLPEPAPDRDRTRPITFACFSNPSRISERVLACWGAMLRALPEGRLVLKYMSEYGSEVLRRRILDSLTQAGAALQQVEFVRDHEPRTTMLQRYNHVDVVLDTFPVSGWTTSMHALAMGVPIVTWPWDRMVSRWTGTMLRTIGLPQLVGTSEEHYVRIAIEVARDRSVWWARRTEIRTRLASSRLSDARVWTRRLERFYWAAITRTAGKHAPVVISTPYDVGGGLTLNSSDVLGLKPH